MVQERSSSKNKKSITLPESGTFFIGRISETTQRISNKNVFLQSIAGCLEAFSHQLCKRQNPTSNYPLTGACSVISSDSFLANKTLSTSESNKIQVTSLFMNNMCKEISCWGLAKTFGQCPAKGVIKTIGDEIKNAKN